jgi:23S rRNA pseudouridine1911/1915/1917 synthase
VRVNGEACKPSRKLRAGDHVDVDPQPMRPDATAAPQDIPIGVLFEDDHLVVVDKPAGLCVHPSPGHRDGTLVNALLHRVGTLAGVGGRLRPGIVHRLDKDTSGVMVATKDDATHQGLSDQFRAHTVERRYVALVRGAIASRGTHRTLYGRDPRHRLRFSARVRSGKPAVTHWRVLERLRGAALVEARIETGRTHQVRVHLADLGHPVIGDRLYGGLTGDERIQAAARELGRQALHAATLSFVHPVTGARLAFASPLPDDVRRAVERLRC